ncbi:MAG: hypothetical protein K9L74_05625 [Candidatus Izimaplasma sp.]|nr:hypothetical protein [Candidatus Izimaplasma bacterium]
MKKELLVISDNFNEYSKYRALLETSYTVSLRSDISEVEDFIIKNSDLIDLIIIDIDDNFNNGLNDFILLIKEYNIPYIIIVDSYRSFLNYNLNVLENDIISRQSIYPNLISLIRNKSYDIEEIVQYE